MSFRSRWHSGEYCLFSELVRPKKVVSVTLDGYLRGFMPDVAMMDPTERT